jgi:hypothetical protein
MSQTFFVRSCIGEICKKNEDIVKDVLKTCGVPFFLDILNTHHEETVTASSYVIQVPMLFDHSFLLAEDVSN